MLTACPECRTTFRISQEQLDAKRGLVRCGHCNAVFNAYDALLPEIRVPPAEAGPETPPVAAPAPAVPEPEPAAELPGQRQEPRLDLKFKLEPPEPEPAPEPDLRADILAGLAAYREEPPVEPVELPPWLEEATREPESPDSILLSELPVREKAGWQGVVRGLFATLLVLLLIAQALYFLRSPLAAWQPVLRPYLEAACAPFGCQVPLPRDRDALRVESSSLETDPESPASARLRVAFSNRADQAMAWPHLVLTLTDLRDKPLAQRVFAPREYLPARHLNTSGIKAGQEYEVQLDLDLASLTAAGYRVALEYP
ncbi:putative Zn finger-like uncharacterized protein [Sulfuritortus calidifontis]|uniref:Putative Zn finger-like uncharacterized protein n=1 Tax=Sulfuritortus calidifontis TaxID=1914471 RepID=A0A4R3JU86_9PROT|nr:DUF3426 domain-containing protein [Sulfuritortus calidifontis]TCS71300.1 putative Zn finger-like uncharacterized protein [Sulfuritortus calidifontis]